MPVATPGFLIRIILIHPSWEFAFPITAITCDVGDHGDRRAQRAPSPAIPRTNRSIYHSNTSYPYLLYGYFGQALLQSG